MINLSICAYIINFGMMYAISFYICDYRKIEGIGFMFILLINACHLLSHLKSLGG